MFVLSFENENDRTSFSKYYVANVQIKQLIELIDEKRSFDISIKNFEEKYEQIIEMGRNNDYTTNKLWDYEYFTNTKHYKLIAIDLSKQIELKIPYLNQQINFIEKSETTIFEFLQNAIIVVWFWRRIKMETQNIASLLGDADNESSKFAIGKEYVINDQSNTDWRKSR